jgi:hypothetical protein
MKSAARSSAKTAPAEASRWSGEPGAAATESAKSAQPMPAETSMSDQYSQGRIRKASAKRRRISLRVASARAGVQRDGTASSMVRITPQGRAWAIRVERAPTRRPGSARADDTTSAPTPTTGLTVYDGISHHIRSGHLLWNPLIGQRPGKLETRAPGARRRDGRLPPARTGDGARSRVNQPRASSTTNGSSRASPLRGRCCDAPCATSGTLLRPRKRVR